MLSCCSVLICAMQEDNDEEGMKNHPWLKKNQKLILRAGGAFDEILTYKDMKNLVCMRDLWLNLGLFIVLCLQEKKEQLFVYAQLVVPTGRCTVRRAKEWNTVWNKFEHATVPDVESD